MRTVSFAAHNKITLLHGGATEFFPALVAAFDAATDEIFLETYIFANDDAGTLIAGALKRAAARGVTVNVITDWIGTGRAQTNRLNAEFIAAKVNHRSFNPWFRRGVARTHRKICVVDRKQAFLGGININDDMYSDDDAHVRLPAPRWDFAVSITGPLVDIVQREVESQWMRAGNLKLKERWQEFRKTRARVQTDSHGPALAALVVRDNLRNRRTIERAYLQSLGHARHSVWLANPYFAPGRKLRRALASAAQRGVQVTLLLGVGQYRIQDAVAHSFYPKLLKSGVKIVEYRVTQLHGKVAVIDDEWATVGSSNYDGFSLFVNQEANVVIKDGDFAATLRARIEQGVAAGVPVNLEEFAHMAWYKRATYGVAYLLYKGMMRIITLGRYAE